MPDGMDNALEGEKWCLTVQEKRATNETQSLKEYATEILAFMRTKANGDEYFWLEKPSLRSSRTCAMTATSKCSPEKNIRARTRFGDAVAGGARCFIH